MKYLEDYIKEDREKLFKSKGSFFAFSSKQLEREVKKAGKETSDYILVGSGLICLKENVEEVLNEMEEITKRGVKQDIEENGVLAICKREFHNHETKTSRDAEPAIKSLKTYIEEFPKLFNKKILRRVFQNCYIPKDQQKYF